MSTSNSNKIDCPFSIWVTPECLEKINHYATQAVLQKSSEIGGFGRIQENGSDIFLIDIFVPTQSATGGTFDISPEMDNEFMRMMIKEGRREELPEWKSLWHSHPVGMGPSMSGTDITAIRRRAGGDEAFSFIISASRNADSERMAMHYCTTFRGKELMIRDMPVNIGWSSERMRLADEASSWLSKKFDVKLSDADADTLQAAIREAVCTNLPPTFESERNELVERIKREVGEKLSSPYRNMQQGRSWSSSNSSSWEPTIPNSVKQLSQQSDVERMWEKVQRLYCIGYELIDPSNPNPSAYVTKKQAKKAKEHHRKCWLEMAKLLREADGFAPGDLVLATKIDHPDDMELTYQPHEIEDIHFQGGVVSYEVGGSMFWSEELQLVTPYEVMMGWQEEKEGATA